MGRQVLVLVRKASRLLRWTVCALTVFSILLNTGACRPYLPFLVFVCVDGFSRECFGVVGSVWRRLVFRSLGMAVSYLPLTICPYVWGHRCCFVGCGSLLSLS
jgi:hypothetical protein